MLQKLKSILTNDAVFYSVLLILVALASFGLGRQSVSTPVAVESQRATPILATQPKVDNSIKNKATSTKTETVLASDTTVVASKSGTKYHLPTCPGAKQIKEANLISFASIEAAKAAGYTPAANCPGLQ